MFNLLGTAATVLGLSALAALLFGRLLPAIDLPPLPHIDWPAWLSYLDPGRYLGPLIEQVLGWVPDWEIGWLTYVVGFLVAVGVAVREVRRRTGADATAGKDSSE